MFHLYKIIFPECCKLYTGSTGSETRYGSKNKMGQPFTGDHRNPEVQSLLDKGYFALWVKIKSTPSEEEVRKWEENYLKKVWDGKSFKTRPRWLLNRTTETCGTPTGFEYGESHYTKAPGYECKTSGENHYTKRQDWDPEKHWTKQPENQEKLNKTLLAANSNESIQKRKQTRQQTESNPDYMSPLVGRKRPKQSEMLKKRYKCPFCDLWANTPSLSYHVKRKHHEQP
jgi:hypothetical protein